MTLTQDAKGAVAGLIVAALTGNCFHWIADLLLSRVLEPGTHPSLSLLMLVGAWILAPLLGGLVARYFSKTYWPVLVVAIFQSYQAYVTLNSAVFPPWLWGAAFALPVPAAQYGAGCLPVKRRRE